MGPFDEVRSYLERLPHGTASYPDCVVRASIYEELRQELPTLELRDTSRELSAVVATYLRQGPTGDWIPEVWGNVVLELWYATVAEGDERRCRTRLRALNGEVFESALFRTATRVLSPSLVLMGMARTWGIARRGSSARATMGPRKASPRTAEIALTHPAWVFAERQLCGFEEAFTGMGHSLGVDAPVVERVSAAAEETVFRLEWHER